jgi:D-glycero-D-manno-heptose 1,7-bisphosphate phosphatase
LLRGGLSVPALASLPGVNDEPSVAVLFDRDGTLVEDVPYNGDPRLVKPMPGASDALALLRSRRIRVGVVSNQSGVGRGFLTDGQVHGVHARIEQLLGPFDDFRYCPHTPEARCDCRKPALGADLTAAARLAETLLRKDMA